MRGWGVVCSLLAHLFLLAVIIWTGDGTNFNVSGGSPGGTYDGEPGDGSYVQGLQYVQIGGANGSNVASDADESESPATQQSPVSASPAVVPPQVSPELEKKVPLPQETPPENSPVQSPVVKPVVKDVAVERERTVSEGSEVSRGAGSAGSRSDSGGAGIGGGDSRSGSGSSSGGKGAGGSGGSPGGSGGTGSNKYAARPTGVFLPPLPAPRKVQGFTLQALFEIDTLGRARLIRHNRSPDSDYNKRLAQLLRSLTFTTARSVDTDRPVIDTVLVTYTF